MGSEKAGSGFGTAHWEETSGASHRVEAADAKPPAPGARGWQNSSICQPALFAEADSGFCSQAPPLDRTAAGTSETEQATAGFEAFKENTFSGKTATGVRSKWRRKEAAMAPIWRSAFSVDPGWRSVGGGVEGVVPPTSQGILGEEGSVLGRKNGAFLPRNTGEKPAVPLGKLFRPGNFELQLPYSLAASG